MVGFLNSIIAQADLDGVYDSNFLYGKPIMRGLKGMMKKRIQELVSEKLLIPLGGSKYQIPEKILYFNNEVTKMKFEENEIADKTYWISSEILRDENLENGDIGLLECLVIMTLETEEELTLENISKRYADTPESTEKALENLVKNGYLDKKYSLTHKGSRAIQESVDDYNARIIKKIKR